MTFDTKIELFFELRGLFSDDIDVIGYPFLGRPGYVDGTVGFWGIGGVEEGKAIFLRHAIDLRDGFGKPLVVEAMLSLVSFGHVETLAAIDAVFGRVKDIAGGIVRVVLVT